VNAAANAALAANWMNFMDPPGVMLWRRLSSAPSRADRCYRSGIGGVFTKSWDCVSSSRSQSRSATSGGQSRRSGG